MFVECGVVGDLPHEFVVCGDGFYCAVGACGCLAVGDDFCELFFRIFCVCCVAVVFGEDTYTCEECDDGYDCGDNSEVEFEFWFGFGFECGGVDCHRVPLMVLVFVLSAADSGEFSVQTVVFMQPCLCGYCLHYAFFAYCFLWLSFSKRMMVVS